MEIVGGSSAPSLLCYERCVAKRGTSGWLAVLTPSVPCGLALGLGIYLALKVAMELLPPLPTASDATIRAAVKESTPCS